MFLSMKRDFERMSYVAPRAETICFHAPLSVLIGMSAEADLDAGYSDEGELIDATEYDKLNGGN
jgi:hypothetical protein